MRKFYVVTIMILALSTVMVSAQETVNMTIRCIANIEGGENWRCDNFSEVEAQVEEELGINLELTLIQDNKAWGDYKQEFVLATEAGEAPDIILSGHEDIGAWAPAGFIIPLDELMAEHEEFDDVVERLWDSQMWGGQVWGIPQDAEARPIFYSKLLLADLGWTDEEIESLPERVAAGEYTFADMLDTAEQAVNEGVVEAGKGYYHRPSNGFDWLTYYYGMGGEVVDEEGNVVFDTEAALATYELIASFVARGITREDMIGMSGADIYPEVAPGEQVLFDQGGIWHLADWARNYVADLGGVEYLQENIGFMLFPAMSTGEALTLTHPLSYLISSESEHPEVAMALLAAVTTPDANNRHAIDSFHLGILKSQIESDAYQNDPFLSGAHYMLDYTTAAPNDPAWNAWSNAYWTGITAAHSGASTPQEAVDLAVAQLQNEAPDIIIR